MKRPLRFCLLTTFYPPYNFGGDGVDVERLAHGLTARGHHVTVVHEEDAFRALAKAPLRASPVNGVPLTQREGPARAGRGGVTPAPPATFNGIEIIGLRSRLGVISPLLTQQVGRPVVHRGRLGRLFRERPFDIVSFNNVSLVGGPGLLSFGGDAVRLYLAQEHWLVCPSHVLWRHNREACSGRQCLRCVLTYRRPPQLWRYTGYLERQLRHVDMFVARSEFSRDKHREFGFGRRMEVLPYFLPGAPPETRPIAEGAAPHPRPYFLFVGRLERIKGLDTIIPVFARYPDADLVVVGDGEEAETLKALAARIPRVRFAGRVANRDLGRYYQHAIATIVPSVGFETFGIVLIEAFRYGTPVIARRIGPFPEIVEQSGGGQLFANDDELVAAMRRLQDDPQLRADLGARGYRACRERWSEHVVVPRYLELVAEAARERATRLNVPPPTWLQN